VTADRPSGGRLSGVGAGLAGAARRPPYEHALVVSSIAVVMAVLFVASYALALGRPKPHEIPTALVGRRAYEPTLVAALERAAGSSLKLRRYPSQLAAERAIGEQRVYAALVLTTRPPRLLIAGAAGASVANVLKESAQRAGRPLQVIDVRPLRATAAAFDREDREDVGRRAPLVAGLPLRIWRAVRRARS
jgi:hypothetical protein